MRYISNIITLLSQRLLERSLKRSTKNDDHHCNTKKTFSLLFKDKRINRVTTIPTTNRTALGAVVVALIFLITNVAATSHPVIDQAYAQEQVCAPSPADMVSWWPGDGNADDIKDGNDGTSEHGTTFGQGKVGRRL